MTDPAEGAVAMRARRQPETLRLNSVAAGITVNDLEASVHWYCDIVGFYKKEEFEHEGNVVGVAIVAGSEGFFLSQDDGAKGLNRVKGTGIRLFLKTSQDIDEVAEAIKSRGGVLESEPTDMPWGVRSFNLVDPDGFQLTITT